MYVAPDRFDRPLALEGWHDDRTRDLEETPIPGVEHVGAGMVAVVSYHPDHGVTYEQSEPVGENWHRYAERHTPDGPTRLA